MLGGGRGREPGGPGRQGGGGDPRASDRRWESRRFCAREAEKASLPLGVLKQLII